MVSIVQVLLDSRVLYMFVYRAMHTVSDPHYPMNLGTSLPSCVLQVYLCDNVQLYRLMHVCVTLFWGLYYVYLHMLFDMDAYAARILCEIYIASHACTHCKGICQSRLDPCIKVFLQMYTVPPCLFGIVHNEERKVMPSGQLKIKQLKKNIQPFKY